DWLHGRLLDGLDRRQQIFQFLIRFADDAHAGNVADIAVIIAAGIEREHVALLPALIRGRAVETRARRYETIIEGEPARGLFPAQRFRNLLIAAAHALILVHRRSTID